MPNVLGILETALSVENVEKSAAFYRRLFNFDALLVSERLIALNVARRNVLLLFKAGSTSEPFATPGGLIPGHTGQGGGHLAFSIPIKEFPLWQQKLQAEGIAIESIVNWDDTFRSLYFRDPDNHLVELITEGYWALD